MVTIGIGFQTFTCRVGFVPQLHCGVLIGRDSPILAQLLRQVPETTGFSREVSFKAELVEVKQPKQRPDLVQLTRRPVFPVCLGCR